MEQKPTKGRVVMFKPTGVEGSEPLAALIVKVWNDECVNLIVFDENGGTYAATSVRLGDDPDEWSWPVRV